MRSPVRCRPGSMRARGDRVEPWSPPAFRPGQRMSCRPRPLGPPRAARDIKTGSRVYEPMAGPVPLVCAQSRLPPDGLPSLPAPPDTHLSRILCKYNYNFC